MRLLRLDLQEQRPAGERKFVGLEAVRAGAATGVVMLHACVPYALHPMPGLPWSVRDEASAAVDWVMWSILLFIMPLFLLLSGFLAGKSLQRHGPGALLKSRARRLLKPFLVGMILLTPIVFYVFMCGWLAEGHIRPVKLRSLKFTAEQERDLWGSAHLWFLLYVFTYVALVSGWRAISDRRPGVAALRFSGPVVVAGLAIVGIATVALRPEVVWGFQHAFLPVPSKWIFSGTFFLGGLWLAANDPQLQMLRHVGPRLLLPSLLVTAFSVALGCWRLSGGESAVAHGILAILSVAAAWGMTLSVVGVAERTVTTIPAWVSSIAAASFWIYLVHHPLVALIHIDMKFAAPGLAPGTKMLLTTVIAFTVSLITYRVCIDGSRFGCWLGVTAEKPRRQKTEEQTTTLALASGDRGLGVSKNASATNRRAA